MSLRTYPFITHPAYINHIGNHLLGGQERLGLDLDFTESLPQLNDAEDIAKYLGISSEIVWGILLNPRRHYRSFVVRKRSGGLRPINSPRTFLKVIQWWINDTILTHADVSDAAHGFVKGKSPITNAKRHLGARHILNIDIENFFGTTSLISTIEAYRQLGYSLKVSSQLANLTTYNGSLPQGAPTSPTLSNIIFHSTDNQISEYAERRGLKYSRYADDITLSSNNKIPLYTLDDMNGIINSSGFKLNKVKTKFMGPGEKLEITGLILGENSINIDRKKLKAARGWFHSICQRPEMYKLQLDRIGGTVSLIRSVGGAGSAGVVALGLEAYNSVHALI